ncbi:MAG: rod shape-determining protein MreC [Methylotenera sp.]|nr:rod shape-determining protein MreC [Methylotenera sp.]
MARGFNNTIEQQQAPAFFVHGLSAFARLAFFSGLSLALMAIDSRLQYLDAVRQNLQTLLHPLQLLANTPSELYRDTGEYFSTHNYLLKENKRLKQHTLLQDISLQKLNTLTLENNNLRLLLNTNKAIKENSTVAEIMHVSRDLFSKKIIVNRGETHGISAGEAVVDATGVIGQITRVYPLSSEVTLITDKSLAIPIQIERNGLRAIAFGHGRDSTLDLPYLPTNVDIKQGDKLVTSGIDGVYPAGLAVATVKKIEITSDSPFARIVCNPTGGVENYRQVLLVSIPHQDILPDSKPAVTLSTPKSTKNTAQTKLTEKLGPEQVQKKPINSTASNNTGISHAPE